MVKSTEEIINKLTYNISKLDEVQSIGISGSKSPFPRVGEGDIDIFIYCNTIPDIEKRQAIMNEMGDIIQEVKIKVFEGGHWGIGDFGLVNGVETWLMYFTVEEALNEVKAILNGEYPDKLDNYYYPVGRCAMLQNMNVLCDKNEFLSSLKKTLTDYPEKLEKTLIEYHLEELEDKEDLERAVVRKDALFYHFALDITIDHFLQALFAMNRTYFPSRKRTAFYIDKFKMKPEKCNERLLEVVRLGGDSEGIKQSYELLCDMINELKELIMVYEFNGKIFEEGQKAFISIPFNVWDECGVKGSIPVKVTIDEFTFECKLVPKGNGNYYIPIKKGDLKNLNMDKELKISFQVISALSRINKNSPYSLEKPIRKIDSISIITPSKKGLCGQATVAMLAEVSLDEVINLMGSQCSLSKVIEALDYYGIPHSEKMVYRLKEDSILPKCCIINTTGHLMVFYDGKYYDPSMGLLEEFDISKITGFLEILI